MEYTLPTCPIFWDHLTRSPDYLYWAAWALALGGPLASTLLLQWGWGKVVAKRTEMIFDPEFFWVKTLTGWDAYNRALDHSFAWDEHKRRENEQRAHERAHYDASRKGKFIQPKVYYGKSVYICYQELGKDNDLMAVYDLRRAKRLLAHLAVCDEVIEGYAGKGQGTSLDSETEWNDQPGEIPEDE